MPVARYSLVAFDCPDTVGLANFYQQIIGGTVEVSEQWGELWVVLRSDAGADIAFQHVADHEPPNWPDGTPQQAHLDFDVADLEQAEADVVALGARKHPVQPSPDEWRVFLDPAGHPFCLCLIRD